MTDQRQGHSPQRRRDRREVQILKQEEVVVLMLSPRSLRSLVSVRTGERWFLFVIPEAILIGNPCFTDRKAGSPIEAFEDDRSKARAFTAETQGTRR
jgi:hypothetical protein